MSRLSRLVQTIPLFFFLLVGNLLYVGAGNAGSYYVLPWLGYAAWVVVLLCMPRKRR